MSAVNKFTDLEKHLFTRMIDYFIEAEKKELLELNQPSGNKKFIPQVEKNLEAFKLIKNKIENLLF